MESKLFPGEYLEDISSLHMIVSRNDYKFGLDALLLSDYAQVRQNDCVYDLGCGDGILLFRLYTKMPSARYKGIELRKEAALRGQRSIQLNALEKYITIMQGDLRKLSLAEPFGQATVVICNPPYRQNGTMPQSNAQERAEVNCSITDIFSASHYLLKSKGRLYLIFPCVRLEECILSGAAHGFHLKDIRFVHTELQRSAKLCLLTFMKDAHIGLNIQMPLILGK